LEKKKIITKHTTIDSCWMENVNICWRSAKHSL